MTDHFSQNNSRPNHAGPARIGRPVGELVAKILEPSIARKTGMRTDLLTAWAELAGPQYANLTRPEKIDWPRRTNEDDPFKPAALVVACDPACALFFQHSHAEILERVNRFFGFHAIERIRIVQKPVMKDVILPQPSENHIAAVDREKLDSKLAQVKDDGLRQALEKLGKGVMHRSK